MSDPKKKRVLKDIIHLKGQPSSAHDVMDKKVVDERSTIEPSSQSLSKVDDTTPFPWPSEIPSQVGDFGIRYDFCLGIRVRLPKGMWKVRIWDQNTETLIFETEGDSQNVLSRKKHFIDARIEVEQDGKKVWEHVYNARNKKIAVSMPGQTIGDALGWFPYALRFSEKHGCALTVVVSEAIKTLLEPVYPDVTFVLKSDFSSISDQYYAIYYIGLFFHDETNEWQPSDFRMVGLHRTAAHILGVDTKEEPPKVFIDTPDVRPIKEPYVVIASQASCACKLWNNPTGWIDTVQYLKEKGYRVVCIDRDPIIGEGIYWNSIPLGVEDQTGNRALSERARWIKHADFFVGLSSGLSWLAWAVRTPVVMISGFTHPENEFRTPYRVFSTHGCNSCWHDIRVPFKHDDYMFCPRHKGTPRYFECTRLISSDFVNKTIDRLCVDYGYDPLNKRMR